MKGKQIQSPNTFFFVKGQPIRDSTEKIPQNKGHYAPSSTEREQNKGQTMEKYFFLGSRVFAL